MNKQEIFDIIFTHPHIDKKGWIFKQNVDWDKTEVKIDNDDDNYIEWGDGTWYDGTWEGGIWYDGYWKDGTWLDGTWRGGFIFDGEEYVKSTVSPKEFFNDI